MSLIGGNNGRPIGLGTVLQGPWRAARAKRERERRARSVVRALLLLAVIGAPALWLLIDWGRALAFAAVLVVLVLAIRGRWL